MADTSLMNIGKDIMREALVTHTKEAAEVVSEKEDTMALTVLSMKKIFKKKKTHVTVLSSDSKINEERFCCIFTGSTLEIKDEINKIFPEEIKILFKSDKMKRVFKNFNICTVFKNKKSIKNLVVKTNI